jgi:hypothetical protein
MIDPRIMVRELIALYPNNTMFHDFICQLNPDVLYQLYSDVVMHGAKLVQTTEEWNDIPEKMGWNAPNFCR